MQGEAGTAGSDWYFIVNRSQVGPVDDAAFDRLITEGTIGPRTLVWREGLEEWEEAAAHADFGPAGRPPAAPGAQHAIPPVWEPAHPACTGGLYEGAPARGFFEAVGVCLRRYFTLSGRASRSEYWFFVLFMVMAGIVAGLIDFALFGPDLEGDSGPVGGLVSLLLLIPSQTAAVRRLHDTGRSGWWVGIFWLMPLVIAALLIMSARSGGEGMGLIVALGIGGAVYGLLLLVLLVLRGDPGPNRYG